jgi:hypothetical protein
VVDEDTGEAVADRAVDKQGGGRRVDSAGEAADRARVADLGANRAHLLLDHGGGRPSLLGADDVAEEAGEDLGPVGGVDDLRVELNSVEPAIVALEGGDRRLGARGERVEARRWLEDGVAMAHPALLLGRSPLQQLAAVVTKGELAAPELAGRCLLHSPAELVDHELHPVTDAQDRDPEVEQLLAERRGAIRVDRGGAAGEHQSLRPALLDPLERRVVREQLAEDAALADAAGDQLGVLTAEVEDENLLGGLGGRGFVGLAELRLRAGNAPLGNVDPSLGVVGGGASQRRVRGHERGCGGGRTSEDRAWRGRRKVE